MFVLVAEIQGLRSEVKSLREDLTTLKATTSEGLSFVVRNSPINV